MIFYNAAETVWVDSETERCAYFDTTLKAFISWTGNAVKTVPSHFDEMFAAAVRAEFVSPGSLETALPILSYGAKSKSKQKTLKYALAISAKLQELSPEQRGKIERIAKVVYSNLALVEKQQANSFLIVVLNCIEMLSLENFPEEKFFIKASNAGKLAKSFRDIIFNDEELRKDAMWLIVSYQRNCLKAIRHFEMEQLLENISALDKRTKSSLASLLMDFPRYSTELIKMGRSGNYTYLSAAMRLNYAEEFMRKFLEKCETMNYTPKLGGNLLKEFYVAEKFFEENKANLFKVLQTKRNLAYASDDYVVIVPTSYEEMEKEAETQHNCVASYYSKIANNVIQTNVVFIRKKDNPEESFITCEVRFGKNGDPKILQWFEKFNNINHEADDFKEKYLAYLKTIA